MGIRLGGIGLVMLQINLIFFLVIKLFVLRDWGELNSEDKELIQAMAFHKSDKEKIETKKTKIKDAERNRRMKPVPAPQSFQANQSVTAPPNDLQESEKLHEARTQCDSIGSKEKFSGAHASRSTDQNGYVLPSGKYLKTLSLPLRVSNSENQQSTRLPRAKKGHQVDVLKLQEDLILADSQEDPEEKDKEKNVQQKTKSN